MSDLKVARGPLATKIADLSKCAVDVSSQSESLKSSLHSLLRMHTEREQNYAEAVKYVQDNYDGIIKEAEIEAERLIATATSKAHNIVATAKEETEAWMMEKAKLAMVQQFQPKIKLDVGGSKFTTSLTTLRRFPDTMIGAMFSGRHALPLDEDGYHFVDRDGTHFRYILNFLRSPETFELDLTGSALKELKSECDYYGIWELMFPLPTETFDKKIGSGGTPGHSSPFAPFPTTNLQGHGHATFAGFGYPPLGYPPAGGSYGYPRVGGSFAYPPVHNHHVGGGFGHPPVGNPHAGVGFG